MIYFNIGKEHYQKCTLVKLVYIRKIFTSEKLQETYVEFKIQSLNVIAALKFK